jgi:hypothetical protein
MKKENINDDMVHSIIIILKESLREKYQLSELDLERFIMSTKSMIDNVKCDLNFYIIICGILKTIQEQQGNVQDFIRKYTHNPN